MLKHKIFILILGLFIVCIVMVGFRMTGSPADQRAIKLDLAKYTKLSGVKYSVEDYFRNHNRLPENQNLLPVSASANDKPEDFKYDYKTTGPVSYQLCTEFVLDTSGKDNRDMFESNMGYSYNQLPANHKKGYDCLNINIPETMKNDVNRFLFVSPTPAPEKKLLGYWNLDSVKISSDPAFPKIKAVSGVSGTALSFTGGTDSYFDINENKVNSLTGDFTLSLWTQRFDNGSKVIAATSNDVDGGYAMVVGNEGEVYCRTSNGNTYTDSYTDTAGKYLTADGKWHFIAIVKNQSSCDVYIDGSKKTQNPSFIHQLLPNSNPLTLGGRPDHSRDMYNGYIDDVRLYNYAQSADQIKEDFSKTSANEPPQPPLK